MKKIVIVRLDKACDPEVESLKDVVEFVKKVAASEEELSEDALELISAVAEDLGLDASTLKADVLAQKRAKHAAEAKAKEEALKKSQEAVSKSNKGKPYTAYETGIYETGAIDGYEKGFKDCIKFIISRINKSFTTTLSDLNDMAKWNFKDGTLKEDAVFKK